jgi:hypothetical protein
MRTTVTLDPDVQALVEKAMQDRKVPFKTAINDAIRAGLRPARHRQPYRTLTFDMGQPRFDLTKALQIAGDMEDAEIVRKMAAGK